MIYKRTKRGYVIRLFKDEDVLESLKEIVEKEKLASCSLVGIGAVSCVRLGYYDMETKGYYEKEFMGNFELVNLTGNITFLDGNPLPHCHATIADHELKVSGGHLASAKVAVTVEIFLTDISFKIERTFDKATGLKLMDF